MHYQCTCYTRQAVSCRTLHIHHARTLYQILYTVPNTDPQYNMFRWEKRCLVTMQLYQPYRFSLPASANQSSFCLLSSAVATLTIVDLLCESSEIWLSRYGDKEPAYWTHMHPLLQCHFPVLCRFPSFHPWNLKLQQQDEVKPTTRLDLPWWTGVITMVCIHPD